MIEQDTIKLLRECDAGIKMGVASIDDVLDHVKSRKLHSFLSRNKQEHELLKSEIQTLLDQYGDDIIVVLINIVGFLCCCVGLYVTSIISEFMYVELYYRLSNDGNPASPAEDVVFDGRDADGYNRSI